MHALLCTLLSACIGVLAVLALRRPLRRLAGPGPAFALWLLPLTLAAAALLPSGPVVSLAPIAWATLPAATSDLSGGGTLPSSWLLAGVIVWAFGSTLMLLRLGAQYVRLARAVRPLPEALREALPEADRGRTGLHPDGPAALWGGRARILLPPDFLQRFDTAARQQVLAHEHMHIRRGDPLWTVLAEAVLALLWFFPPVWWARHRFSVDQELACDAAVLRARPTQARPYAHALLQNHPAPPHRVLSTWGSPSPLKERLLMIRQHTRRPWQRRLGYALLATLLATATMLAQAALPAQSRGVDTMPRLQPASHSITYPTTARAKHQQGTVVLLIHVDASGRPQQIQLDHTDAAQDLVDAALQSARQWRFQPATRDGQAVSCWIELPVRFTLKQPAGTVHV